MAALKDNRICRNGHTYYDSSDSSLCPTCHAENKPDSEFLLKLVSPARNALLHEGVDTLEKLSRYTEKEVLSIHGIGPSSLPIMKSLLEGAGLSFQDKQPNAR